MRIVNITIEQITGRDDGQSGHERHQLILSEDEEFLGIVMLWVTKPPPENELTSS